MGIPRVVGMNSVQAVAAMASRGYRNVGSSVVGGAVAGIYFNPMTRECVQLANAQGRVVDAREIGSHPPMQVKPSTVAPVLGPAERRPTSADWTMRL